MKVAITAASGQLGAAIVREAIQQLGAEQVVALARTPSRVQIPEVEARTGDYDDPHSLQASLEGVDVVLLVSSNAKPEDRPQQHRNVMDAAKKAGVRKIVYTSVLGPEGDMIFSKIVNSNRATERDIQACGLEWSIGRNGIYIEPDLEYVPRYKEEGKVWNCAGEGRCAYTSRAELAAAYVKMMTEAKHNEKVYNLAAECITQQQLTDYLNQAFGLDLIFENMTVEAYQQERAAELGDFLGTVIAGIYQGILSGAFDVPLHYEEAAGRAHKPLLEIMQEFQ